MRGQLSEMTVNQEAKGGGTLGTFAGVFTPSVLTILGIPFRLQKDEPACVFEGTLDDLVRLLPLTALVLAAQEIDLDAEPEEGRHQEIAQAVDAAAAAKQKAGKASRDAETADTVADRLRASLATAREQNGDPSLIEKLEAELKTAEEEAEGLKRRAAKVSSKAAVAAREADAVTGQVNGKREGESEA